MRTPLWIFDLDNTLHHASLSIFPQINQSMTQYIRDHLELNEQDAHRLREHYWHHYGATLTGLVRHHRIDPRHFLWHTHQFPDLAGSLAFDPAVRHAISRLPGKKILFSNAPAHYTRKILKLTRLAPLFEKVFTIESVRFNPKPALQGFRHILRTLNVPARHCIMVEDSLANLVPARQLGMKTVWVYGYLPQFRHGHAPSPHWINHSIASVRDLPRLGMGTHS